MPKITKSNLNEWVRTARGGRTIPAFARMCGMSAGQLSQLETGTSSNPTLRLLSAIAAKSERRCDMKLDIITPEQQAAMQKPRKNPQPKTDRIPRNPNPPTT